MAALPQQWTFTYADLADLTGLSANTLQQHRRRGSFDPEDLGSIVLFAARHAPLEFRQEILKAMLEKSAPKRAARKKKATGRKKKR